MSGDVVARDAAVRSLIDECLSELQESSLGMLDVHGLGLARRGAPELGLWLNDLMRREHSRRAGGYTEAQPELRGTEASLRNAAFALGVVFAAIANVSSPLPDRAVLERLLFHVRTLIVRTTATGYRVVH